MQKQALCNDMEASEDSFERNLCRTHGSREILRICGTIAS